MKIITLMKRINKLRVEWKIVTFNSLNYGIYFLVNGQNCFADCDNGNLEVNFFGIEHGYDEAHQETNRRFFGSFKSMINFANRGNCDKVNR